MDRHLKMRQIFYYHPVTCYVSSISPQILTNTPIYTIWSTASRNRKVIRRRRCAGLTVDVVAGFGFVAMEIEGSGRTTERRDRSWWTHEIQTRAETERLTRKNAFARKEYAKTIIQSAPSSPKKPAVTVTITPTNL